MAQQVERKVRIIGGPDTWLTDLPNNHGKFFNLFTTVYTGILV